MASGSALIRDQRRSCLASCIAWKDPDSVKEALTSGREAAEVGSRRGVMQSIPSAVPQHLQRFAQRDKQVTGFEPTLP